MTFEDVVHLAQLSCLKGLGPYCFVPFKLQLPDVVVELLLLMHCLLSFLVEKLFQFLTLLFKVCELLGEVLLFYLELFRVLLLSLSRVKAVATLVKEGID